MEFKIYTASPKPLNEDSLNFAIDDFVEKSDSYSVPLSKPGFKKALWDIMGNVLVLKNSPSDFVWMALDEAGVVKGLAITGISKDVDDSLTYWGRCAWVHPELRNTSIAKTWFNQLREHAKQNFCKHFIVISSRNNKAYLRFLGKTFHTYATLLKEDY